MKESDAGIKWFYTIFYPERKMARAARYEDGVLPRLRKKEVNLFTPWGPRYDWKSRGTAIREEDRESVVLNLLAELFGELKKNFPEKKLSWLFVGADLYGTRINNLPVEVVIDYFESLQGKLAQFLPEAEFRLWSQLDRDAERYREVIRKNFRDYVDKGLLERTIQTARNMGRGSDPKAYLIERLAEAMLVEEMMRPIKISCAPRHKDDKVDWELPRLYFLPDDLCAPWP
jgi:hypothetical protein